MIYSNIEAVKKLLSSTLEAYHVLADQVSLSYIYRENHRHMHLALYLSLDIAHSWSLCMNNLIHHFPIHAMFLLCNRLKTYIYITKLNLVRAWMKMYIQVFSLTPLLHWAKELF